MCLPSTHLPIALHIVSSAGSGSGFDDGLDSGFLTGSEIGDSNAEDKGVMGGVGTRGNPARMRRSRSMGGEVVHV